MSREPSPLRQIGRPGREAAHEGPATITVHGNTELECRERAWKIASDFYGGEHHDLHLIHAEALIDVFDIALGWEARYEAYRTPRTTEGAA